VPPRLWTAVFTWSPVFSLLGAGAGGILLLRLLLISSSDEYHFGPDIPIEAAVLVVWGASVVVLMNPPRSVLACQRVDGPPRGHLWSLGRKFRVWNVSAAPAVGLLLVVLLAPLAEATSEQGLLPGTPSAFLVVPFTAAFALIVVLVARIGWWGVELKGDVLIARGFLRSRRYQRDEIEAVWPGRVSGLGGWVLGLMMNNQGDFFTVKIRRRGERTKTLYASHSTYRDAANAAQIVKVWLTHPADTSPGSSMSRDRDLAGGDQGGLAASTGGP